MHEVLDAYGHISARSDKRPDRFLISRSRAPALVTAADLMELGPDSEPSAGDKRKGFIERYIHGEIYRTRPDVMAVVHSHSPSVIPFGATRTRLRPIYHMGSFLWSGSPVFDIRKVREENDLLVRDRPLGKALAETLGGCNCVLMRGHGMTVVGGSVQEAVFRAIYTEMNARLQLQAAQLEGPIEFLSEEEGRRSSASNAGTLERPWELWKKSAMRR
jgi:ribulose-5-phosphate 4-epimerase/fuculose-1-phosphate aldolase